MRRGVLISFVISFVCGLPIWWKTTFVYRAVLPHLQISLLHQSLKTEPFTFPVNLHLSVLSGPGEVIDVRNCKDQIGPYFKELKQDSASRAVVRFEIDCHHLQISGKQIPDELISELSSKCVEGDQSGCEKLNSEIFDNPSLQSNLPGDYHVILIPSPQDRIHFQFTKNRKLFVFYNGKDSKLAGNHVRPLASILHELFSNELKATVASQVEETSENPTSFPRENNLDNLRTVPSNDGYQLTFSLMVGDENLSNLNWEIQRASKDFIQPFLKQLENVTQFDIESQIQYFADLTVRPEKAEDHFFLKPQLLTRFINSGEWNLASAVSAFPSLSFVTYIPKEKYRPLFIHDLQGQVSPSNAFLVPRWGGVFILNPPKTEKLASSDLKPIMEVFLAQIRTLIGVKDLTSFVPLNPTQYSVSFSSSPQTGLTDWELDALIRKNILSNLGKASETLLSLSNLVEKITNMMILDDIQDRVEQSINLVEKSRAAVLSGEYFSAVSSSKEALRLAEKTFFDPNMVAMLYFPDEHKYAIYVPLFLPISFPIILAVITELKSFRSRGKDKVD